jgi:hypothetical protein
MNFLNNPIWIHVQYLLHYLCGGQYFQLPNWMSNNNWTLPKSINELID